MVSVFVKRHRIKTGYGLRNLSGVLDGHLEVSENKGSVYAKASVLHDWNGRAEGSLSYKSQKSLYRYDLGGTWGEFAVGGTYNPTKNLSAYGQVKTSTGSLVRNPWQVSIGLRYSF